MCVCMKEHCYSLNSYTCSCVFEYKCVPSYIIQVCLCVGGPGEKKIKIKARVFFKLPAMCVSPACVHRRAVQCMSGSKCVRVCMCVCAHCPDPV